MKITIDDHKFVASTVEKEIEFPYYGWYDNHKYQMIKLDLTWYEYDRTILQNIKVIELCKGFALNTSIDSSKLLVRSGNVVENKLTSWLSNYSTPATEKEFLEFRQDCFNELI